VQRALEKEGKDPNIVDMDPEKSYAVNTIPPAKDNQEFSKFFKVCIEFTLVIILYYAFILISMFYSVRFYYYQVLRVSLSHLFHLHNTYIPCSNFSFVRLNSRWDGTRVLWGNFKQKNKILTLSKMIQISANSSRCVLIFF
jgi:hypothetical protein